jgi:hypothetical protein
MTSLFLLAACGNQAPAANQPRVVALSRPNTLATEAVPATVDQALEALDRGLSGIEFQTMQRLPEDDAATSYFGIEEGIQSRWGLSGDGALRRELARSGFQHPADMSEAILRMFWRRLHGRPIDLDGFAREVDALREAARVAPHGVLFPEQSAESLTHQCGRPMPGVAQGTWIPDAVMVANLEDALLPALQQALDRKTPSEPRRLFARDYYRQYGGLIVGGKRIIYINGFHRASMAWLGHAREETNWRTSAVRACDGWLRYFGAEYDPDTRQVYAIEFNGIA